MIFTVNIGNGGKNTRLLSTKEINIWLLTIDGYTGIGSDLQEFNTLTQTYTYTNT